MSAAHTYLTDVPIETPLSDCTNAVGNAENINRARTKDVKTHKKRAQAEDNVAQVRAHFQRPQKPQSQSCDSPTPRRPAPLYMPSTSQAASPTVMSPYVMASRAFSTSESTSPSRCHNPYTPLTAKAVDISAEESFYASYTETLTSSADISAISDASDFSVDQHHTAPPSADAHEVSRRRTLTQTCAAQTRPSLATPASSMRQMPVPRSQIYATATANISARSAATVTHTANDGVRPSHPTSPGVTRVVRTVVGCSVDRASGRPIPRFVVNNSGN